eukprot:Lithocolla_globosa_v1_NODE_5181_length_1287_cov_8.938312.p2 type:complete len:179 gc:universal NODE_5181_length_1287_cov_8.938312:229-765(+)
MPRKTKDCQRVSEDTLDPAPVLLDPVCTGATTSKGCDSLVSRMSCGRTALGNRQPTRGWAVSSQPVTCILICRAHWDILTTQLQRGGRLGIAAKNQGSGLRIRPIVRHMEAHMPLCRKVRHHFQQPPHLFSIFRQQNHIIHDEEGREHVPINVQPQPFTFEHCHQLVHKQNEKERGQN